MKWTSLRRWTMRTIHATILGSALLGSASVVSAQPASTAASKIPGIHYTKSQSFDLPVEMDPRDRAGLTEIRIYVKTPTTSWSLLDKGTAELKRFNIRVPQDGEYWYSLVTVNRQGQMSPPDVTLEAPAQRVIVDTTAPVIQVQAANAPDGELCLRCTVLDANPDHATLTAYCKTDKGNIPLETVPNQPGMFRVKNAELMRFPVVISATDMAKNVGTREINVREIVGATLAPGIKGPTEVAQPGVRPEVPREMVKEVVKEGTVLPPPRFDDRSPGLGQQRSSDQQIVFPPPPPPLGSTPKAGNPADGPAIQSGHEEPGKLPLPGTNTPKNSGVPHQLINTTRATVEYRIDQVGPSGVGKVEIYMTPDKGQTWHRLSEDFAKRSPASINLPGDGVYGIRIAVSNGNGFGGRAPTRGDAPHCTIEVDTTSPFVQLRSTDVLASAGHVELRWNATDKNLGNEPVSLFYRTRPDGPWQVIARGVKNDGVHRWAFPRDAGGQLFFKVEVTDLAGNVSHDVSRQPILIDMTEPRATVVGVTGNSNK
jgi:hypothetical protein